MKKHLQLPKLFVGHCGVGLDSSTFKMENSEITILTSMTVPSIDSSQKCNG